LEKRKNAGVFYFVKLCSAPFFNFCAKKEKKKVVLSLSLLLLLLELDVRNALARVSERASE